MRVRTGLMIVAAMTVAGPAHAQTWQRGDQGWCDREWGGRRDSERFCEVRTTTVAAVDKLDLDGGANGGIEIEAWDRDEIEIEARVWANAREEARARGARGGRGGERGWRTHPFGRPAHRPA